ncbi:hypothetical protein SEPCBS119000_004612 [Sporothrix epigloea]|uniref:Uncharacterized protein n=1 Tax=Sporothrix epigloea TaxID=1892477 RepID=A0ABP0DV01_9PEZI
MKISRVSIFAAYALLCPSPADAANCRLTTPSSTSSAAAAPSGPSQPDCFANYIQNKYFAGSSYWSFGGDAAPSTDCGAIFSTCAKLIADSGPASVSQSFDTVPGFTYRFSLGYMYTVQPASDADKVTCTVTSGGSTVASYQLAYLSLNDFRGAGFDFVPTTRKSTLTCTLTSAAMGTVRLTQMAVNWDSDTCEG